LTKKNKNIRTISGKPYRRDVKLTNEDRKKRVLEKIDKFVKDRKKGANKQKVREENKIFEEHPTPLSKEFSKSENELAAERPSSHPWECWLR